MKDGVNSANRYNWITIITHDSHYSRTPYSFTYPTQYIILRLFFIVQNISQIYNLLGVVILLKRINHYIIRIIIRYQ